MDTKHNFKALFIIVNAGYADDVIAVAREAGASGATILNARGEGLRHEVFMGITVDSEKEMILCLVKDTDVEAIMAAIKEKAGIKTPAHSICISMPVDRIAGISLNKPEEAR